MSTTDRQLIVRELGEQPYEPVWHAMQAFTASRDATTPDEIWCLSHLPVYTQGQAGKPEHLINTDRIPVVQIDRGGQVTYHGPGQLLVYLLIDIRRAEIGVRQLVSLMEDAIIATLGELGIEAGLLDRAPGVYVNGAKIASLGLRIRRGCSYHGLALNLDMDLSPFLGINPCGYEGMAVTQLRDLLPGEPVSMGRVRRMLLQRLITKLPGSHDVLHSDQWPTGIKASANAVK